MWYSSGTISATNSSNVITGTGTAFLANVRIGDGITIQGSQSLHEVIGIASNTQLTIKPAFTGTTGGGKQFACAPILGYDKDLSDAFNQLRLQFGDKLSALQPWAYAATANAALDALEFSATGKAIARGSAAQGRTALGLGAAATRDVTTSDTDTTAGRLLRVGDFGVGQASLAARASPNLSGMGLVASRLEIGDISNPSTVGASANIHCGVTANFGAGIVMDMSPNPSIYHYSLRTGAIHGPLRILDSGNTTVDSNGFIKNASPIIKLHSDRIESASADAPAFERIDTGHYQLTGCNGLRLDDGWYIETPHDKNGNKYFNVEWEQDDSPDTDAGILEEPADVTLTIRCYERVWNPQTGTYDNGDPVDITDGRWIDLRMNEVRQPEPEMPDEPEQPVPSPEPADPIIPNVVTMAQAKLALLYAGLFEAAEKYINELPEPHKTAAMIEWNHRQTLERDHPLVGQVADGLGLTEQQLDELFVDAAGR